MLFNDAWIKGQMLRDKERIDNLTNVIAIMSKEVAELKEELNTFKKDFDSVIADTEEINNLERKNAESLQKMMNYDPFNFNGVNSNE